MLDTKGRNIRGVEAVSGYQGEIEDACVLEGSIRKYHRDADMVQLHLQTRHL